MHDAAPARGVRLVDRVSWRTFLVVGLTLTGAVLLVPGWPGELLWDVVPLLAVGAMAVGVRRHRPAAARAWRFLVAGMAWWTASDLAWTTWFVATGDTDAIPWWFDVLYMPTYVLLVVGFALLPRNSLRVRHETATMDAVVVVVGFALLYWAIVFRTDVAGADLDPQRTLSVVSLTMGLAVVLMSARLWFRYGHHNGSYAFLSWGVAASTLADALYTVTLTGDAVPGISVLDTALVEAVGSGAWLVWFVLFGVAALHPGSKGSSDAPPTTALTVARGVVFFSVVTAGPVTFLLTLGTGPSVTVAWADLAVPLVTVGVLSGLLVGRLVAGNSIAQRRAILLDQQAADLSHSLREQRELQELLSHQALHDPLTGLGNRMQFSARLGDDGTTSGRAVLMVDLDGFKSVNDDHGHPAGDDLLSQGAGRMRAAVSGHRATVARLGGDEFAVLLEDADDAAAEDVAWRIVHQFAEPFVVDGEPLAVTASVGVRVLDGTVEPEEALRDADLALYAAKSAGKNQACVFTPRLRTEHAGRSRLLSGLKHAVSRDELAVEYQPVVDLRTRQVLSVEALVRWDAPRGRIMPDQFIPLAEETGLIVPIGEHVLRRALADVRPWYDSHAVAVHVNVSARQVRRPDIVSVVGGALDAAGLPGTALVLEITETALLATGRPEAILVAAHLTSLRDLGVRIAIDDFGTGYSSLAYLQRLPVDIVKIDGAFTRFAAGPGDEARRRRALATAIIDLCASLDLQAVAEQIETEAEAQAIAALGCPQGQGYLFGRPVPPDRIAPLLGDPAGHLIPRPRR